VNLRRRNFQRVLLSSRVQRTLGAMEAATLDDPVLRRTPAGWQAIAIDHPLVSVIADTEEKARQAFHEERELWRSYMAEEDSPEPSAVPGE
jgi:hypothetical protein